MARREPLIALAGLTVLVGLWLIVGSGLLASVELPIHDWVVSHRLRGSSLLASYLSLLAMGLAALAVAWLLRAQPWLLVRLGLLTGAVWAVVWVFKQAGRGLPGWGGNNFPSGHAAGGAFLSLLLVTVLQRRSSASPGIGRAGWVATGLIATATLYPMAHLPSETLGGVLLGVSAASVARLLIARPESKVEVYKHGC